MFCAENMFLYIKSLFFPFNLFTIHFLFLYSCIGMILSTMINWNNDTEQLCFIKWLNSKDSACNAEATGDQGSITGLGKSFGEGHGNPLQCSCLEEPHGQRLMGYCLWGLKELHMTVTKHTHLHYSFSAHTLPRIFLISIGGDL